MPRRQTMSQILEDYEYSCIDCDRTISRTECETCGYGEDYPLCSSCMRHEWLWCDCCVGDCEGCHNCEPEDDEK